MLKGTIDDFTLPDVFRLMSLAKKTGKLDVTRSAGSGTVFFREGDVYYAESSVAREPLGQKLIKAGHLTEGQLMRALDEHASSGVRVGEVLVTMHAVTEEQLQSAVKEQIEDAVFDLLRWDLGEFSWESGVIADVEVPIQVSGENLIMEASRRLDELESLLRKIPSENAVLAMAATPPEGAVEIKFTPEEWRLLVLVDGRRSVHEVAEMAGMDDLTAMKAFYGVVSAGLVEVVADPGITAPAEAAPSEPVADRAGEPEVEIPEPESGVDVSEPVGEVAPRDEEFVEEAAAEPLALTDIEPVGVPELDLPAEEAVGPESPPPDPDWAAGEMPVEAETAEEAADDLAEPVAAGEGVPEDAAWDGLAPDAFDAPAPEEMVTETPSSEEDPFLSELLGSAPSPPGPAGPAPEAPAGGQPPAAPPAPERAEGSAAEGEAAPEPESPEVDRAAVVRELAGLFDDDIEQRARPVRASPREEGTEGSTAANDERKRVEDDDQVTRGLISRLIDGVKGL